MIWFQSDCNQLQVPWIGMRSVAGQNQHRWKIYVWDPATATFLTWKAGIGSLGSGQSLHFKVFGSDKCSKVFTSPYKEMQWRRWLLKRSTVGYSQSKSHLYSSSAHRWKTSCRVIHQLWSRRSPPENRFKDAYQLRISLLKDWLAAFYSLWLSETKTLWSSIIKGTLDEIQK